MAYTSQDSGGSAGKQNRMIYSTAIINQLIADNNAGYEISYDPFYQRDLDLRAPNIVFKMTKEEMDIYQKCYDEPLWYIEHFCKFETDNAYQLVNLRDFQKEIIGIVTDEVYLPELDGMAPKNRNVIWMAARQSGKTTTIVSFLSWMLIFHAGRNILVAANKFDTVKEIVDKLINVFKNLPFFLKPGCESFGKTGLTLDNGSRILSTATTKTASIGFTLHCILLDEFAHIPENIVNNFWRSIYPTLSSSKVSQCIIISTPNGTTNKFYDLWSGSVEGRNSFVHLRTDYYEVPEHDDAWAAKQRADFGDEEFAQEFELQFNINSRMLLTAETLSFLRGISKDYVNKRITVNNMYLKDPELKWHPDFDPNNINRQERFVVLVDIAEGHGEELDSRGKRKDPDFNTLSIYRVILNSPANIRKYSEESCNITDAFRFIQVGRWMSNVEDETYMAKLASAICYDLFNDHLLDNVRLMVEMNFNGKSFTETFKKHNQYTESTILHTYHTKPIPGEHQRKRLGFKTVNNKEYYCLKGKKQLIKRRIVPTDKITIDQMQAYGYVRGKLKGIACHDDLSMPTFNHIPRMLDESTFTAWLSDYMYTYYDEKKKYAVNEILKKWAMDNPEMTDTEFAELYGLDQANSLMSNFSEQSYTNPYSNHFGTSPYVGSIYDKNPYSSGNMSLYSALN